MLTVPLELPSLTKPASIFQSRSPLVGRPEESHLLCSSASAAIWFGDVNDDHALVVLSDCNDFASETSCALGTNTRVTCRGREGSTVRWQDCEGVSVKLRVVVVKVDRFESQHDLGVRFFCAPL